MRIGENDKVGVLAIIVCMAFLLILIIASLW